MIFSLGSGWGPRHVKLILYVVSLMRSWWMMVAVPHQLMIRKDEKAVVASRAYHLLVSVLRLP